MAEHYDRVITTTSLIIQSSKLWQQDTQYTLIQVFVEYIYQAGGRAVQNSGQTGGCLI